ncbi:Ig-like domain-containing protein [Mycolicibacterium lacusdiani]|uniref:Ig-like domain-containing protein n=1 Tax=Mycolicibacterium lacusdiani TaxID=2895283 RepID=UPI001F266042|nr:Ig-like domain-containing protein [Mycolicibacterium lacusdiani]
MAAHRSNTRSNPRRAGGFAVVRWLKVGAASAGISAALLGWSATGAVGIAAADDSNQSSSASSDSTSSKDDKPTSKDDGPSQNDSATDAKDDDKDVPSSADDAPAKDDEEAPEAEDEEAEPTKESEPTADPQPDKVSKPANDAPPVAPEPQPQPAPDPDPTPARTAAAAPVSTPTLSEPIVTTAAAPEIAQAVAAPTPPWALQAVSSHDARQQTITAQLNAFTSSVRSLIDALPLHPVFKVHLEGALWTARRTFLNQAPTVAPVLVSSSGGPIAGRVDAVDPEGDRLVYRLSKAPTRGSVLVNPDGTYVYTPGADFNGVDTFVITADDMGTDVNLLNPFRGVGTSAGMLVNQGAITFSFNYTTGAQYWSTEARDALRSVADGMATQFLVTAPVVITYDVTAENSSTSGKLAAAGSDLVSEAAGFLRTVVQNKLITGVDANGSAADGEIEWNFAYGWGLGDTVGADEYDFASTAMHELLHSFGFLSYIDERGKNTGRSWTSMDGFIVTQTGAKPIGSGYRWNTAYDGNLTGAKGGLFFGGAHAVAAYGGLVPLFTPNPWESGSSGSHLDDATFTGANQKMMNAKTDTGLGIRVLSQVELGILRDLGYTVVPQTSTVAMAAMVLIVVRRTRKAPLAKMEA